MWQLVPQFDSRWQWLDLMLSKAGLLILAASQRLEAWWRPQAPLQVFTKGLPSCDLPSVDLLQPFIVLWFTSWCQSACIGLILTFLYLTSTTSLPVIENSSYVWLLFRMSLHCSSTMATALFLCRMIDPVFFKFRAEQGSSLRHVLCRELLDDCYSEL